MTDATNAARDIAELDPCRHAVLQLWDYLDGRLPDRDRAWVAAHLETCHACTSHYTFEQAFLEKLRAAPPADPKLDALRQRVLRAIREKR